LKIKQFLFYFLFLTFSTLILIELCYRYQVVDFYRPELSAFNKELDGTLSNKDKVILCMGDSFTAGTNSYPEFLRSNLPDHEVINSGISGTGVIQAAYTARNRFKQFDPEIFIYQIYAGNDLFDIRYPARLKKAGSVRNLYWSFANQFRSISFLNYRSGQLTTRQTHSDSLTPDSYSITEFSAHHDEPAFSVERYSKREQMYFEYEPGLIENQVMLLPERRSEFNTFITYLKELLSYCDPEKCKAILFFIPDASQVSLRYLENVQKLGASFSPEYVRSTKLQTSNEYPFLSETRHLLGEENFSNVSILNPLEEFRRVENNGIQLYFNNDPHLTHNGHLVLSQMLLQEIKNSTCTHHACKSKYREQQRGR
jgi:hypothetical protein